MTNKPLQIGKMYYFIPHEITFVQPNKPYLKSYPSESTYMLISIEEDTFPESHEVFYKQNYSISAHSRTTLKFLCEDGLTATLITREKPELAFSLVE